MAELNTSFGGKSHGKPSRKKLSTRVDLTPMVDLGFLLITFFIFTTSMSEPKSMKLKLPKDEVENPLKTAEGKTVNLLLGSNHQLWHYRGNEMEKVKATNYGNGIRRLIQAEKLRVGVQYGDPGELVILIKPTSSSTYEDLVNLLDEMMIHQVSRHILVEPGFEEITKVNSLETLPPTR